MFLAPWKPKTTVFFWHLVAKITVFMVFTQFSACCKMSFLYVENIKTQYFTMFCFPATEKESNNGSKTDTLAPVPGHLDPFWPILELCWLIKQKKNSKKPSPKVTFCSHVVSNIIGINLLKHHQCQSHGQNWPATGTVKAGQATKRCRETA